MSYEPRGKTKDLLEAMRADGAPVVWYSQDVAKTMGVPQSSVSAYVEAAIRNGALFREMENGRAIYSLKKLPPPATTGPTYTVAPPMPGSLTPWTPPDMIAPRAAVQPGSVKDWGDRPARAPSPPAPAPAPEEPKAQGEVELIEAEEEGEAVAFDAQLWLDGTLVIYGATENVDGSISISPEQWADLQRRYPVSAA